MAYSEGISGTPVLEFVAAKKTPQRLENCQNFAIKKAEQRRLHLAWSLLAYLPITNPE